MRFLAGAVLGLMLLVPAAPSASAQQPAGSATLRLGTIDVTPSPPSRSVAVAESFTVDGIVAGAPVDHLLASFPDARVDGLAVTVGDVAVPTATTVGTGGATVTFRAPTDRSLSYRVSYTVAQGSTAKVPILVPAFPTDGGRVVRLSYHVPDGYHVQGEPFPVVIGSSGVQRRELVGVPSFLDYELGTAPSSGWGLFSWLGVVIIVVSVVMSAVVMARASRAGRR